MKRNTELIYQAMEHVPAELYAGVVEFFPSQEVYNACAIAYLESGYDAFALNDTVGDGKCGDVIAVRDGIKITAERSVGYFQINSCNFPDWEWQRLYNARHNAGTAHMLWQNAGGWSPWYFSAVKLGLLEPST